MTDKPKPREKQDSVWGDLARMEAEIHDPEEAETNVYDMKDLRQQLKKLPPRARRKAGAILGKHRKAPPPSKPTPSEPTPSEPGEPEPSAPSAPAPSESKPDDDDAPAIEVKPATVEDIGETDDSAADTQDQDPEDSADISTADHSADDSQDFDGPTKVHQFTKKRGDIESADTEDSDMIFSSRSPELSDSTDDSMDFEEPSKTKQYARPDKARRAIELAETEKDGRELAKTAQSRTTKPSGARTYATFFALIIVGFLLGYVVVIGLRAFGKG